MRITSRWLLVCLVVVVQLAFLGTGLLSFSRWLDVRMTGQLRRQVLSDNLIMARQMARLIGDMEIRDSSYGSEDWSRMQRLVEQIELPNEGFLCVVEQANGQLLCHPELSRKPAMREMRPGRAALNAVAARPGDAAPATDDGEGAGWAQMHDGVHLIAAREVPDLGIRIMAHQRASGVSAAVASVVVPIQRIGLGVIVLLTLATAFGTGAVVLRYESRLAKINAGLEQTVARRSKALMRTRDAVIFGLAKLAESRDTDTGEHLERVYRYVEILTEEVARHRNDIDDHKATLIAQTSSLHDIGKVGVPDEVLLKPGPLDPHERQIMQRHPLIGGDCLVAIRDRLGEDDFLTTACEVAFSHHEHWDGGGYPFGLAGEDIPVAGRIVALADVYDALTSKRVYKDAMSHERAMQIISEGGGTQFDPQVVASFLKWEHLFARIAARRTTHGTRSEKSSDIQSDLPSAA
ncbi:MAG: hypothetical protein CMJ18_27385 [Phycisphaeraceae bacterium]|nr:hypothetical protein [Phycisphaeraceae bacterium]